MVDKDFQRRGLPKAMLDFLMPYLMPKFDLLFSIGVNENPKRAAHEKAGWKILDENEFNYYCSYDLTNRIYQSKEKQQPPTAIRPVLTDTILMKKHKISGVNLFPNWEICIFDKNCE